MKIRVKYLLPINFYHPDKRSSRHSGRILKMCCLFWDDSERKNSILLRNTFEYGFWEFTAQYIKSCFLMSRNSLLILPSSMVGELSGFLGFSVACQPCNPIHSSSVTPCSTVTQKETIAKSCSHVRSLIPTPGWEAGADWYDSLIVMIHAFSIFVPSLAQLWKTKYSNTPEQGAGLGAQSGATEEPGGTGMSAGWAVNCTFTPTVLQALSACEEWGGCEHSGVNRRWGGQLGRSYCDQQQRWVATASPWRQRAHLSQHLMDTPGWS